MQTLEEFLKDKTLPVKVNYQKGYDGWLEFKFSAEAEQDHQRKFYYGVTSNGFFRGISAAQNSDWTLYQPPKKKVKKWLWAYESYLGKWRPTEVFYSEVEIIDMQVKSKHHKLENTMIEVEE